MAGLNDFGIEIRSSVLFAAVSLILSLLVGMISGIGMSVILLRVLVIVPLFAALGYGLVLVIKRYVPEFYDLLAGNSPEMEIEEAAADVDDEGPEISGIDEPAAEETVGDYAAPVEEKGDETFSELTGSDFPQMSSSDSSTGEDIGSSLNLDSGKLGKHILNDEKAVKYEPKIMAQAIRTMISRDED